MMTSGAASGDHSAGLVLGSASGAKGRNQTPSPGKTLLFLYTGFRSQCDALRGRKVVAAIVAVPAQKFLRKVCVIVIRISLRCLRRAPRCSTRHIRSP